MEDSGQAVGGIKSRPRYTVDIASPMVVSLEAEPFAAAFPLGSGMQPNSAYVPDMLPPSVTPVDLPSSYCTRIVHTSVNAKMKSKLHCLAFSPLKPYVFSGSEAGHLTRWSASTFVYDKTEQGHPYAVRAMAWNRAGDWLLTGDRQGQVRYWQSNMRPQEEFRAHEDVVRGISFSPTDSRFCTGSDDGSVRVWDFWERAPERKMDSELRGHGAQVTCVGWHPHMGLIASGSRDNLVILWDPKAGKAAHTIHGHKNEVQALEWNPTNPHWLVTGSRDQSLRFFDLRTLAAFQVAVTEHKGVTALAWHPFQERLLAVGNHDGCLQHWAAGLSYAQAEVPHAHDSTIAAVAWAPAGNILVSGSHDSTAKFWGRSRPGDTAAQYAYHGNPMRGYPRDNENLVPVPGTAAAAAAAASAGAYGAGLAPRSFEEQEADRAESFRGGVVAISTSGEFSARAAALASSSGSRGASRGPQSYPPAEPHRGGGGPSLPPLPSDYVPKTVPGDSYRCKLCGLPGHWFQACPNAPQRSAGPAAAAAQPRDASGRRPPPADYVCHECGLSGHWRESCPSAAAAPVARGRPPSAGGGAWHAPPVSGGLAARGNGFAGGYVGGMQPQQPTGSGYGFDDGGPTAFPYAQQSGSGSYYGPDDGGSALAQQAAYGFVGPALASAGGGFAGGGYPPGSHGVPFADPSGYFPAGQYPPHYPAGGASSSTFQPQRR